jgi:hypothetical protein
MCGFHTNPWALSDQDPDTKVDYFKVTHKIKEEVTQPSILVGGTLKDYQVRRRTAQTLSC